MTCEARWLLCLSLATLAPAATAAELSGRLTLEGKGARGRDVSTRDAVVYFTPGAGATVTPAAAPLEIVTVRKAFDPRVLAVPVGTTVRFPNQDPILHNVFSVSEPKRFDLGLYRQGEGEQVTFDRPGVVRVFCNVHHAMVAYVLVLETPFHTRPDGDGSFRLRGLPAGEGTLTVWHERAEPWTTRVRVPDAQPLAVALELSRGRVPRHLNKFGKPYEARRAKRY